MDHKAKAPKHKKVTVLSLRKQRRDSVEDLRKKRRTQLLKSKRIRLHSKENKHDELTETQVQELAKNLQSASSNKEVVIKSLRRAFGQGSLYIDAFLSVDNSLQTLVGLLSGNDAALQLEAVWCISNIAAGMDNHAQLALDMAAPYLITYLTSSNETLVDQCAWALGNIAGDSTECSDTLREQGVLQPLLALLKSHNANVVRSSLFALSNLARNNETNVVILMELGIGPNLLEHLNYAANRLVVIAEAAWVLSYLTASGKHDEKLLENSMLAKVTELLAAFSTNHKDDFKVVTPLLRCLGNLCSGDDKYCREALMHCDLLNALSTFLQSEHRHVKKESLWAISNLSAEEEVSRRILATELVERILEMTNLAYDVKKEIVFCICNLASHGEELARELCRRGAVQKLVPFLAVSDTEVIHVTLLFAEIVLRTCGDQAKTLFEESDGVSHLEAYEYHNNDQIRTLAHELLDTYFTIEVQVVDRSDDMAGGGDAPVQYPPWRQPAQL